MFDMINILLIDIYLIVQNKMFGLRICETHSIYISFYVIIIINGYKTSIDS